MNVTLKLVFLVVAIVLFAIYGLIGADWITSTHPSAFLGFGLVSFAAAHL